MTSPQMARPMNVPIPYVQHNSFPGNMAPYGSMYNPKVVVESNRAEASGGLPTRASTNMGTETSHIELRNAETQHSALPSAVSFMRARALPRPTHAGAQTLLASGEPTPLFSYAGRPSGSGGGGGSNPYAFAIHNREAGDVVKTIGHYREAE